MKKCQLTSDNSQGGKLNKRIKMDDQPDKGILKMQPDEINDPAMKETRKNIIWQPKFDELKEKTREKLCGIWNVAIKVIDIQRLESLSWRLWYSSYNAKPVSIDGNQNCCNCGNSKSGINNNNLTINNNNKYMERRKKKNVERYMRQKRSKGGGMESEGDEDKTADNESPIQESPLSSIHRDSTPDELDGLFTKKLSFTPPKYSLLSQKIAERRKSFTDHFMDIPERPSAPPPPVIINSHAESDDLFLDCFDEMS